MPSQLPHTLQRRIGAAGLLLGRLFQLLNYVWRCSFDTILCGSNFSNATIKFTECNGRWGGTSTPMSFMNRLFGDYRRQPYVASVLHDDDSRSLASTSSYDSSRMYSSTLVQVTDGASC